MSNKLLLLAFVSFLFVTSCKDDDTSLSPERDLVRHEQAEVALEWMKLFIKIDRYTQDFRPCPSARALAYINLAAYESVVNAMPDYQSLQYLFSDLSIPDTGNEAYHYPTIINSVYASLFKRFLPGELLLPAQQSTLQFEILGLEQSFNESFRSMIGSAIFDRSKAHGEAVANLVWEWSKTDAFGHKGYENAQPEGYTPPTGPGLWQPTTPDFGKALFPYWGNVRTFSIRQEDRLSEEPLVFSEAETSSFFVQGLEVRNIVSEMDFNRQWIAEFWSDDFVGETFSPVARWISITNQVLENDSSNLELALYAYAKLSIALNDAAVAAWHSKYTYNVERPVAYVQRNFDPDWLPHRDLNPSFPAFPSGHSTFGAAAAEVLSHVFGYSYAMTDRSHEGRTEFLGMPRSFDTFYQMAEENAMSRLYLGVHFRMDAEEGLRLGYEVGRNVNEMPFK